MSIAAHFEEAPVVAGQSRARRRRLQFEVQGSLESGKAMQVQVHNLSETGLLLETSDELEIGDAIDLDLPEAGQARARVAWASGQLYGCAFDAALSASALSAVQLRSAVHAGVGIGPSPIPQGPAAIGGESLGERLHRLRKLRGFTQGELAARLGVSKPTVWAWEQGRARPIEDRLDAIAEALGVTSAELRPSRTVPGLPDLIARCRDQIAAAVETTPDKVRIMIEL
jgi:transcriptional regulator with XRE-family HTH domain